MAHEQVSVRTQDGDCPVHVFTPSSGEGPWPGAIFYMDGLGIRLVLFDMGQRLADAGYVVLLPDLYYRMGPYPPFDPKAIFAAPEGRAALGPFFSSTNPQKVAADTGAYLAYLDTCGDVKGKRIGVTGYCMGGAMALTAAGTYPDRIAAAASFHGGNLATDAETSPHLLVPRIKAKVYVAGADKDAHYPPEMQTRLDQALTEAGVDHRCEIYPDALHGWTMADFPIYNEAAAERHWRELTALFAERLG